MWRGDRLCLRIKNNITAREIGLDKMVVKAGGGDEMENGDSGEIST